MDLPISSLEFLGHVLGSFNPFYRDDITIVNAIINRFYPQVILIGLKKRGRIYEHTPRNSTHATMLVFTFV